MSKQHRILFTFTLLPLKIEKNGSLPWRNTNQPSSALRTEGPSQARGKPGACAPGETAQAAFAGCSRARLWSRPGPAADRQYSPCIRCKPCRARRNPAFHRQSAAAMQSSRPSCSPLEQQGPSASASTGQAFLAGRYDIRSWQSVSLLGTVGRGGGGDRSAMSVSRLTSQGSRLGRSRPAIPAEDLPPWHGPGQRLSTDSPCRAGFPRSRRRPPHPSRSFHCRQIR